MQAAVDEVQARFLLSYSNSGWPPISAARRADYILVLQKDTERGEP
jgi:hypothetical protein